MREFLKTVPDIKRYQYEFDGTTLLTPLDIPHLVGQNPVDLPPLMEHLAVEKLSLSCDERAEIDRGDEEQKENFLHRVFHMALNYSPYQRRNQKYLVHQITTGPGFAVGALRTANIWRGFTLSVLANSKGSVVVHELAHRVELKGTVADWLQRADRGEIERKCAQGTRFAPVYNPKTSYALLGVVEKSLDSPMDQDTQETFRHYYTRKFTIERGSKKKQQVYKACLAEIERLTEVISMLEALTEKKEGGTQKVYLIPQLCKFIDLPEDVRKALPVLCGAQPQQRAEFMTNLHHHLAQKYEDSEVTPSQVLEAWGLKISEKPLCPKYFKLDTPQVVIGDVNPGIGLGTNVRRLLQDTNSTLSADRTPNIPMDAFAVLRQKGEGEQLWAEFAASFKAAADRWHWKLPRPAELTLPVTPKEIESFLERMPAKIKMVVISLGSHSDSTYKCCKRVLLKKGIPSQAVNRATAFKPQLRSQWNMLADALIVQLLAKCDMPVTRPYPPVPKALSPSGPSGINVCVICMDVYHSPKKMMRTTASDKADPHFSVSPSIAGFGCFWFKGVSLRTYGRVAWHNAQVEIVQAEGKEGVKHKGGLRGNLAQFVSSVFDDVKQHKIAPEYLIVFRDGVGKGQESTITKHEMNQVDEVLAAYLKEIGSEQGVDFTYCLATRKIKQSMVYGGNPNADKIEGLLTQQPINHAPAGAVINDPSMVADPANEFFLFSMGSSPATARSVHYRCLKRGKKLGLDSLQSMALSLSHVYPLWPGPVLVPAPSQYASKAVKLAADIFDVGQDVGGLHRGMLYL